MAYQSKITGQKFQCSNNESGDDLISCHCGVVVRRKLKWKRNFRSGKFVKRFLPSLHTNIFEETEKFSTCVSLNSGKIIFGSEQGSVLMWQPSARKDQNIFKKFKISNNRIEFIHTHENKLFVIENGIIHIYEINDNLTMNTDNCLILDTGRYTWL